MSWKVVQVVFGAVDKGLPVGANAAWVLTRMANHAEHDGSKVFPSIATLASETKLKERTVQYAIKELKMLGVLVQECPGHGAGRNRRGIATHWRIDLEGLNKGALHAPSESLKGAPDAPSCAFKGAPDELLRVHEGAENRTPIKESYEPVLEPVTQKGADAPAVLPSVAPGACPVDPTAAETEPELLIAARRVKVCQPKGYPPQFEEAWRLYQHSANDNKATGFRSWQSRIRAKQNPAEIIDGIRRYARFLAETPWRSPMHFATFVGPDEHWKLSWEPDGKPRSGNGSVHGAATKSSDYDIDEYMNRSRGRASS
jgi:hypothetical protein